MITTRWYWVGLIACGALLATAYFYFELRLGLDPCPLCMFQRVCLVGVAFMCLLGIAFKPRKVGSKFLALGASLFSTLGLAIAGRQVWLQHLPKDLVPECGPDLGFMLEVFPMMEIIETVLQGSGECAEVQWSFLFLSMPEWMVLVFAVMVIISLRLLFSKERNYFSGTFGR
ncbi:MAG: disulfide bond formation protein DsbB [Cryomorphaceae bacterium]